MSMIRKIAACTVALGAVCAAIPVLAADAPSIVTVVKVTGENWFTRMEDGRRLPMARTIRSYVTSEIGPAKADAAQQGRLILRPRCQGCQRPRRRADGPGRFEGTLKRAMDRGIMVVTHEADNQMNTKVDVEAFDNAAYGAASTNALRMHGQRRQVDDLRRLARQPYAGAVGRRWRGNAKKYSGDGARRAEQRILRRRRTHL